MKRYFYLLLFVAALTAASCMREPVVTAALPEKSGYDDCDPAGVLKGWVRIRLAEDSAPLRIGEFTRGEAETGNPQLDKVASAMGATEIKVVFPTNPRFEERHRRYGLHLWYDVKIDEEVPVSRAQAEFADIPGIAHVQPIYLIQALDGSEYMLPSEMKAAEPAFEGNKREMPFNDPGLPLQWHYDNDGSLPNSVEGADIGVFEVWKNITGGDPSVIVAVMDTGVEFTHEDLAANMWVNEAELNGEDGKDDDGNGYRDDLHGYDFYNRRSEIIPGAHGTHVAGTVAAVNNNGIGVCGVAGGTGNGDGVKIMTCPLYSEEGMGTPASEAFIYAADNGAVISQNSWNYPNMSGGPLPEDMSVAFDYFIENAGVDENGNQTGPMKGGIIVFAAGNDKSAVLGMPSNDPRVIAVTAMMPNYVKGIYSNFGDGADLFAPGGSGSEDYDFGQEGKVYSLGLGNTYAYMNGTSMACPHVSGVAALIVAHYGVGHKGFTNEDLKTILLRSYRNVDAYQLRPGIAAGLGMGLVDVSLMDLENPGTAPDAPEAIVVAPATKEKRLSVSVEGIPADANGMGISYLNFNYAPQGTAEGSQTWVETSVPCRLSMGETLETEFAELKDATTYVFRVCAVDRFGNKSAVIEGSGKTMDHINRPPEISKPLTRIDLPKGEGTQESDFIATVELSDYFTDPDMGEYGDELSFEAVSNDAEVVKAGISGSILTIEGIKIGDTYVKVTVTDLAGASISKNIGVRVLKERETPPEPPIVDDPVELRDGVLNIFPNPAPDEVYLGVKGSEGLTVDIEIYDTAARRVYSASGLGLGASGSRYAGVAKIDVSSLSPGAYTVSATLSDGRKFQSSFVKG